LPVSSTKFWHIPSTYYCWSTVILQLTVKMNQQCSSASSCMWTCIVMEEHYTFCSEWPCAVLFSVSQYASDVSVVPCCTNCTISTHFLAKTTIAIRFQADDVCLNFLGLFGECGCTRSKFANSTQ
jgi:hypothetical protein